MNNLPNKYHTIKTNEVNQFLKSKGFLIDDVVYHNSMSDDVIKILQYRNTSTSFYIRSRADRIAVHRILPIEFEYEIKTQNRNGSVFIEAMPLAHHIHKSKLGINCMYIFHDFMNNREFSFWTNNIPPISKIIIPDRWDSKLIKWFESSFSIIFPNIQIEYRKWYKNNGSGDPYIVIEPEVFNELPRYIDLINRVIITSLTTGL